MYEKMFYIEVVQKLIEFQFKIQEKLEVVGRFEEKVKKIEDFCAALNDFDKTIKMIDTWMKEADGQVKLTKICSKDKTL